MYYITLVKHIPTIMKKGLMPTLELSINKKEEPVISLYSTYDSCMNALSEWERREIDVGWKPYGETPVVLKVTLPNSFPLSAVSLSEQLSYQEISPKCIQVSGFNTGISVGF